jgi:RNA polymerase sigma factor (sigma-70 family)
MRDHRMRERPFRLEPVQNIRWGGGDALQIEALVESWDEFHPRATASLREMAARSELSPEDAEDAIEEVWLAVLPNLHLFVGKDTEREMDAWMRAVMRHKIGDVLRWRRLVSLESPTVEAMASAEAGVETERRAWLEARLDEKAAEGSLNGQLLCGHFRAGRRIAELAAEHGMTEKAVESRICRQIDKLRQKAAEAGLAAPDAS